VYVDSGQNGRGRLLVAAYSVRPLVGATVGVPLRWDEVRVGLDPSQFTIKTVPNRVKRMKVDPVIETLKQQLDLETVLQDLSRLL
jgi:bifunctional non-homologous end joining protein LigD